MEKLYSEEEREEIADLERSRTISDAKLLGEGAKYVINEDGEKENLLITHRQMERAEALGEPTYQFMVKYFTREVLEDMVKAAEGYSLREADAALKERWVPLIEQAKQAKNDPNYKNVEKLCFCVNCILRGLSHRDGSFNDLYERALKAEDRLNKKDPSKGWSWSSVT